MLSVAKVIHQIQFEISAAVTPTPAGHVYLTLVEVFPGKLDP